MKALKQFAAGWIFVAFDMISASSEEQEIRHQLS